MEMSLTCKNTGSVSVCVNLVLVFVYLSMHIEEAVRLRAHW